MELRHLRYFMAVATHRNFTRAAEALRIAQPPLSRQIRQLEIEIGAPLFIRDSRSVRLTDAGRLFHEQAAQILARFDEMQQMMARFVGAERRRRFVIGYASSAIYGALPALFRSFREVEPELDLSLVEMFTLEQIAALKEGRIDLGFGRLSVDDPAISSEILEREPLTVAIPLGHPLAGSREPIELGRLATEPLILYPRSPRPSYADQILALFRKRELDPLIAHEARELQTAVGLVAADEGLCIVPASVQRLQRNDIVYRPLADNDAFSPIIMSCRAADSSSELARFTAMSRAINAARQM